MVIIMSGMGVRVVIIRMCLRKEVLYRLEAKYLWSRNSRPWGFFGIYFFAFFCMMNYDEIWNLLFNFVLSLIRNFPWPGSVVSTINEIVIKIFFVEKHKTCCKDDYKTEVIVGRTIIRWSLNCNNWFFFLFSQEWCLNNSNPEDHIISIFSTLSLLSCSFDPMQTQCWLCSGDRLM